MELPVTSCGVIHIQGQERKEYAACSFFYVLEGEIRISYGAEPIPHRRSDILFLPPHREITLSQEKGGQLLCLGLKESFLSDHISAHPLPVLSSAADDQTDYMALKRALLKTAGLLQGDLSGSAGASDAAHLAVLSELFALLSALSRLLPENGAGETPARYANRVQKIADYIDSHYAESLSLTDLANVFYLTPQYLSAFFREHFSTNFKSYLTGKRLFYAMRDLRNTDLSVQEVALKNGFSSLSAFQKNMQKYYRTSPSDYRKAQLEKHDAGPIAETSFRADPELHLHLSADADPHMLPEAGRMINAGSVQNLLHGHFRSHLLSFCREVGISMIRIEEMLSNSFLPMILPHREYFYQNADIILAFFYENNLVPFIELSKAESLLKEESAGLREYAFIPRNERFFRLLESFLKHVSRRWPVSWLKKWCFEMSLLPRDTADSYVRDLARVRKIIGGILPEAKVGGPGIDVCAPALSPASLLEAFKRKNCYPDFFSVSLCYTRQLASGRIAMIADPDKPFLELGSLRKLLEESGKKLPVYVTEWTSVPAYTAAVTASRYQAAFLARSWIRLDALAELHAYYLFSDIERSQGSHPVIYSFGRGLCSNDFIPYAAYFAYAFCAKLGRVLLDEGSCYRLVLAEENHFQLLLFHYTHVRVSGDPVIRDVTDFDKTYRFFEDADPMRVRILLTGLVPGLYHTTMTVIDKEHGSLLDVLIDEYTHSNIDKVSFLTEARIPAGTKHPYRVDSCLPLERSSYMRIEDSMVLEETMPPHTVCLFDIRRQI